MLRRFGRWLWAAWEWYGHLSTLWQLLVGFGLGGAAVMASASAVWHGLDLFLALVAGVLFALLAALILLICVEAVQKHHRHIAASKPRLRLWHEKSAAFVIPTGQQGLQLLVRVGVKNSTAQTQENCAIQIQIIDRPGPSHRPPGTRWSLCAPFVLRPDETAYITVGRYFFDQLNAQLTIPRFFPNEPEFQAWLRDIDLNPGSYDLNIEGLAHAAPMARLTLRADCPNGSWKIEAANGT
jgi:hypothetical protein